MRAWTTEMGRWRRASGGQKAAARGEELACPRSQTSPVRERATKFQEAAGACALLSLADSRGCTRLGVGVCLRPQKQGGAPWLTGPVARLHVIRRMGGAA
jgi:hypothetical protein